MAWQHSRPRPNNWQSIRRQVLERDHGQCRAIRADGTRCPAAATEVHHAGAHDDHRVEVLVSLCAFHHKTITQEQARAARAPRVRQAREPEPHPGLKRD